MKGGTGAYTIIRAIERTDALDLLTDHPRTFGTILALMGPYLQIMGTQIYVRHPEQDALIAFHTDAEPSVHQKPNPENRVNLENPDHFSSQPFLHRTRAIFPAYREATNTRSRQTPSRKPRNRQRRFRLYDEKCESTNHIRRTPCEQQKAVIFPWALWHRVGPNRTERVRKSVTFRYGQMWCRPYDYDKLPSEVLARMTPRRRRLFGDMGENHQPTDYYKPRAQLEVICGDEWASCNF